MRSTIVFAIACLASCANNPLIPSSGSGGAGGAPAGSSDAGSGSTQGAGIRLTLADGQTDDFGPVPTNGTAYRTCTLSNISRASIGVVGIVVHGSPDFAVRPGACTAYLGRVLPAGATCSFTVAFSPSAETPESGTVVVTAANGDTQSLTFVGSGAAPLAIAEYAIPTPNSNTWTINAGSDGALWFTETGAHKIGRITTAGGFTEYPVSIVNAALEGGTLGPEPNGPLWYVDADNNQVVRVAMDGTISAYPTPMLTDPQGIALGPDGALWVSAYGGTVGRVTTAGVVTGTFAIPTLNAGAGPITAGPAQTLWFVEFNAGNVARIDLDGSITEFPIPVPPEGPTAITAGPDGRVWFVDNGVIGAIDSLGTIALMPVENAGNGLDVIAAGPDGALWFTENFANRIGRVSTNGEVLELRLPSVNASPTGLAIGPDGAIWFTETSANKIGRLAPGSS